MDQLETDIQKLRHDLEAARDNLQAGAIQDLEERVQRLASGSSGGEHDDVVDLYKEVSALRQEYDRRRDEEGVDVNRLLSKANLRINISGTPADHRAALRILRQVLDEEPANETAYELLDGIIEAEQVQTDDVLDVVQAIESQRAKEVRKCLDSASTSSPFTAPGPTGKVASGEGAMVGGNENWRPGTNQDSAEVERLQARMTQVYYEGDYQEAINLASKILGIEESNSVAKEFRAKAGDYLERGVVSGARIPRAARFSYGRAISLKRAGQYQEAESLFRKALDIAKTEGGINRWSDVEQELMEIADLILQRELVQKGDRLAHNDEWDEAAEMYENAMNIVESPAIRKKYEILAKVVQTYRQVDVRLSMLKGKLPDQARLLLCLREELEGARNVFPESAKLAHLWSKIDEQAEKVCEALYCEGNWLFQQSSGEPVIRDRKHLIETALEYLECTSALAPRDSTVSMTLNQATIELAKLKDAQNSIAEAQSSVTSGSPDELRMCSLFLLKTLRYASDPVYQSVLSILLQEMLSVSISARVNSKIDTARAWLDQAEDLYRAVEATGSLDESDGNDTPVGSFLTGLAGQLADVKKSVILESAKTRLQNDNYQAARDLLEELTPDDSADSAVRILVDRAQVGCERQEAAYASYTEAKTAYDSGHLDRAFEAIKEALEIAPRDEAIQNLYGEINDSREGWGSLSTWQKLALALQMTAAIALLIAMGYLFSNVFG